jgi:ABC-type multidrug transport system permease subunit
MILGLTKAAFTRVHVLLSLAGIGTGFIVLFGLLARKRLDHWTAIFLLTTLLTSLTGFFFPFKHLAPAHIIGIISLVVLAVAIVARYGFHLAGAWRSFYVVSAALALYLNVFAGVARAFLRVRRLRALAPTVREAPFVAAELVVLALFVLLTVKAEKRFRAEQCGPGL